MGTISFLNGLIAIMVPSEAPIGIDSRIAFTINPIMNGIMKERVGETCRSRDKYRKQTRKGLLGNAAETEPR
jgi:predicted DNA-binding protein (UPF0278 family)